MTTGYEYAGLSQEELYERLDNVLLEATKLTVALWNVAQGGGSVEEYCSSLRGHLEVLRDRLYFACEADDAHFQEALRQQAEKLAEKGVGE